MARYDLRRRQATRLTISQQARSQDEIGTAALDGTQHRGDHFGPVAAVTVDEEEDAVACILAGLWFPGSRIPVG